MLATIVVLGAFYVAAPIYAAIELKRAIRTGDVETVRERVAWDRIKDGLRASLAEAVPDETRRRIGRIPIVGRWADSLTQRYAPSLVDRMVDSYATPSGFVQLAQLKDRLRGEKPPRELTAVAGELWQRLRRLSFASLTRVEVEVADRYDAARTIFGAMELINGSWKLTEMRIARQDLDSVIGSAGEALANRR